MAKATATTKKPDVGAPRSPQPAAPKPVAAPLNPKKKPTHEEIAKRAYEIYLRRGGTPGNEQDDWHQAERELMQAK